VAGDAYTGVGADIQDDD